MLMETLMWMFRTLLVTLLFIVIKPDLYWFLETPMELAELNWFHQLFRWMSMFLIEDKYNNLFNSLNICNIYILFHTNSRYVAYYLYILSWQFILILISEMMNNGDISDVNEVLESEQTTNSHFSREYVDFKSRRLVFSISDDQKILD